MSSVTLLDRYRGHINLPLVGADGHDRIRAAKVLLVGAGGLGAPVALYLGAAGIGTLGIIDPDVVSTSNLHRQVLFTAEDVGQSKVAVAQKRLMELNPDCAVVTYQDVLSARNAEAIVADYDLIIDGCDNFSTKFLICDVAHKLMKPVVFAAVDQFDGQVGFFSSHQGACYRCLVPQAPKAKIRNCAESGVLGSLVGMIGSAQASLALQWCVAGGDSQHPLSPTVGRVMFFNSRDFETFKIQVPKNPECPTCSKSTAEVVLASGAPGCLLSHEVSWSEALQLSHAHRLHWIDVREDSEWKEGHLSKAIHWPLSKLRNIEYQPSLPREGIAVFYCRKGLRSLEAVESLMENSTIPLYSLRGGWESIPAEQREKNLRKPELKTNL